MGLDVSAYLVVGLSSQEILKQETRTIDVIKKDKKGISYTVEEEQNVTIFLGKSYKDADEDLYYELLEEHGLEEFNEEIIGIKIIETESHRISNAPIKIEKEDLNNRIESAIKKMESWGLRANLYLIQDISY